MAVARVDAPVGRDAVVVALEALGIPAHTLAPTWWPPPAVETALAPHAPAAAQLVPAPALRGPAVRAQLNRMSKSALVTLVIESRARVPH